MFEKIREHPAEAFCALTATAMLAYEIWAGLNRPNDQLISHAFDRAIDRHPVATRLAIGAGALHLANVLPPEADGFSYAGKLFQKVVGGDV